jgi:2-methylisocitrate lyase-like PEP mutase family enzyme
MPDKAESFRSLHHGPPILVLPNAWDAATARVFEAAGFPAVATTSAGVAAALGYPDGGVVPPREMIEAVARIARAVQVPVTADIEHAYGGTPDAVVDIVLRVIAAGAVGINIEDYVPGAADLEPTALQADKITAVVKAAATAGVRVVVNARTDVFLRQMGEAPLRLDMAVERGRAYRAAGADCVFVPGVTDARTIRELAEGIGGPINILAVAATPPVSELEALGVARVTVGSGPMRASIALVHDIARELKTRGTYSTFTDRALPYPDLNDLMKQS